MDTQTAAGSLFTSCVTNTEPQGIKDLREAKAGYLDALANLRAADAEKVKAEAAVEQAKAAIKQAKAAQEQANAKALELANEATALDNEQKAAEVAAEIARIKAEAEKAAVVAEENLATAQESLRKALADIAAKSLDLTDKEREVVKDYAKYYKEYIDAQAKVRGAENDLYDATYKYDGELGTATAVEAAKAEYEQDKADAEMNKAYFEAALVEAQEMSEAQIVDYEEWVAKYDALQTELEGFKYDSVEIQKKIALNEFENKAALDSFYGAIAAKQKAIAEAKKAGESFKLEFTGEKVIELPHLDVTGTNVVTTFATNVNELNINIPADQWILADTEKDTLGIKLSDPEVAKGAVDTLNIIIDALKREQVVVDQLVKDTAGIAALVVSTKHEYDSIKTVLVAGVDAYKPIADSVAAEKAANKAYEAANEAFGQDTTALIKSIKDFVASLNDYNNTKTKRSSDSEKVFNAFVSVMKAREKALEYTPVKGQSNLNYFSYHKAELKTTTTPPTIVPVEDSVKFSELKYADFSDYAGRKTGSAYTISPTPFQDILNKGFGVETFFNDYFNQATYQELTIAALISSTATNYFQTLLYNKYWTNYYTKNADWGKIIVVDGGVYVSQAVKTAYNKWQTAIGGKTTAKQNYYKTIYCTFWGIKYDETFTDKLNADRTAFKNSADSLKIVYTEKTFTEPTVLPKFKGETDFFTPAQGKTPASIDFKKVSCDTTKALQVIIEQLGKDYLKPEGGFTLYAQYLATAQFANDAKNYKENTTALKELETVVATVKTAYDAAVAAQKSGSALADSLVTKLIGKPKKDVKATDSVSVVSKNVNTFIENGKLAGEQKELVDKYLADYAKTHLEIVKEGKTIDAKAEANRNLSTIYADYITRLYALDKEYMEGAQAASDPYEVYAAIKKYWEGYNDETGTHHDGVLDNIQDEINDCAEDIKEAEANLAKLEAGFDPNQVRIEKYERALERAQAELEAAETAYKAAEAAYQQVLKNHGLAE